MRLSTTRGILAGLALMLASSGSALATDAQAFANRLKEVASANFIPMAFTGAEASGDDVVLKGVSFGDGPQKTQAGDVTFEKVTGSDAEGWKVARVPIADIDATEDGKRLNVTGLTVEGLQIAAKEGSSALPGEAPYYFDSASVGGVKVTENDKTVMSLGATSFVNTVDSGGEIDSQFTLGDFLFDFTTGNDPVVTKTMTDIGYPQLTGNGSMQMSWNPKTGDTSVMPLRVTVENAGELNMSYDIGGYTPAFAKSLAALRDQMAKDPNAAQNSGMAMIGLMSQLSIGSLDLGFTDNSLTGKLLDYYAKQNNQTREQYVAGLSAAVPQLLAGLNNPGFQSEVSTAVSNFLKDPKSLAISIDPENPIPATQVLGAAMGAPQTLPTVLQFKVTSNDQTTDAPDENDGDAGTQPQ